MASFLDCLVRDSIEGGCQIIQSAISNRQSKIWLRLCRAGVIPSIVGDWPVTATDDYAFRERHYGDPEKPEDRIVTGEICRKTTQISIPFSVTNIENGAFDECVSLENIIVETNNPNYSSVDGVLMDKSCRSLIQYPAGKSGVASIPAGVTNIMVGAFAGCDGVTQVTISVGVITIEEDADGLPARWELQYFGGTTNANPDAICSNGTNTVREAYIAGLNPNDP